MDFTTLMVIVIGFAAGVALAEFGDWLAKRK